MMTCPQAQRLRSKSRTSWTRSPSGEMTRDKSFDIANEVRQSFAVEKRLFSLCHAEVKHCISNKDIHRRRLKFQAILF